MSDYTPSTDEVRDRFAYDEWDSQPEEEEPRRRLAFDRWLARHDAGVEAELEARIEDRDYWYRIATEAKDQRDAALSAIANVEAFAEGLMHDGVEPYTRIGKAIGKAIKAALGPVPSTGEGNE